MKLLAPGDPPPFELFNGQGRAPVMLFCDHASRFIPASLGQLGLSGDDLARHIACDIGAADITRHMALRLDAPAVLCNYSRLIIDCNRLLRDPTLIPPTSDGSAIPGNAALSAADRQMLFQHRTRHHAMHGRADELELQCPTRATSVYR